MAPGYLLFLPGLRLESEANRREHWSEKNRRAQDHKDRARAMVLAALGRSRPAWLKGPVEVVIVRIAPKKLDSDNLQGSGKHVRDGIAKALRVDDGDERIEWRVEQRKGGVREYGVEIRIAPRGVRT